MVETIKMVARIGALVTFAGLFFIIFVTIKVPDIDLTSFAQVIGTGLAVFYHWIPGASFIWPFIVTLVETTIGLIGLSLAFVLLRWALKVSEG